MNIRRFILGLLYLVFCMSSCKIKFINKAADSEIVNDNQDSSRVLNYHKVKPMNNLDYIDSQMVKIDELLNEDWMINRDSNVLKLYYNKPVVFYNKQNPYRISQAELDQSKDRIRIDIVIDKLWSDSLIFAYKESNNVIAFTLAKKFNEKLKKSDVDYYGFYPVSQQDSINVFKSVNIWNEDEKNTLMKYTVLPTVNTNTKSVIIHKRYSSLLEIYPNFVSNIEREIVSRLANKGFW